MKRRLIIIGCVVVLATVVGIAGHLSAQALMTSGKIASVDADQQRLKLKTGWFSSKEFEVDPNAQITDGQQSLELEQLQPGDKAMVEYTEEGGKQIAEAITVQKEGVQPQPMTPPLTPELSEPAEPAGEPSPSAQPSEGASPWEGTPAPEETEPSGSQY